RAEVKGINSKAEVAQAQAALAVNICAARGLQDVLRTNLGPKGTMKMLISGAGDMKLTKDGNVLLHEMVQIQHPTASLIAKVATAQDDITGDGTTSNVLIIGELLKQADLYISEGLHPRIIAEGFEVAKIKALEVLEQVKIKKEMKREILLDVARTSLQTKVHPQLAYVLTEAVVDSVLAIRRPGYPIDLLMVEIMEMKHKSETDTNRSAACGIFPDQGTNPRPLHRQADSQPLRHQGSPCTFKNWVVFLLLSLRVLCIFWIQIPFQMYDLQTFSATLVCSVILITVPFKEEFLISMKYNLSIFSFMDYAFGWYLKKSLPNPGSQNFSFMFSFRSAIVLGFIFRSVIHFKVIFVYAAKYGSKFVFSCIGIKLFQLYLMKRLSFYLVAFAFLLKISCVVPGAGAVEVAIAEALVTYKHSIKGRARLGVQAFADALLIIPKVLAQNSGYDLQETLVKVQVEHSESKQPVGIDLNTGEPMVAADAGVWDNYFVKNQLLHS
ncbi:hypothetical protein DBR06_SOUSAS38110019, partial [Sousa chinensis]